MGGVVIRPGMVTMAVELLVCPMCRFALTVRAAIADTEDCRSSCPFAARRWFICARCNRERTLLGDAPRPLLGVTIALRRDDDDSFTCRDCGHQITNFGLIEPPPRGRCVVCEFFAAAADTPEERAELMRRAQVERAEWP